MPNINVRKDILIAQLKPLLPKKWKLIPFTTNLDDLSTTVVMVSIQSIERSAQAPQSHRTYSSTLTILTPFAVGTERADDSIDDDVIDLLDAIDKLDAIKWTKAERGLGNNSNNLGFDITLEVLYRKETSNA